MSRKKQLGSSSSQFLWLSGADNRPAGTALRQDRRDDEVQVQIVLGWWMQRPRRTRHLPLSLSFSLSLWGHNQKMMF